MTERILFDLMGDLDFGLLENDYMERDVLAQKTLDKKKAAKKHSFFEKHAWKEGTEFVISDSLKNAVLQQRELMDAVVAHPDEESNISAKLDGTVKNVKSKLNKIVTLVSSIAAVIAIVYSVVTVIKKKTVSKLVGGRVQNA